MSKKIRGISLLAFFLIIIGLVVVRSVTTSKAAEIKNLTSAEIDKARQFNQAPGPALAAGYFAPILTFHHIAPLPPQADKIEKNLHVLPADFNNMLQALIAGQYKLVFVSELADYLARGEKPPRDWVALSFDDGYEDFYTYVFPLLKQYNLKVSLYVITEMNGGVYLTRSQIKELDLSGLVEIGSHTVDHPVLAKLPPAKQMIELLRSKETLDALLGKPTKIICYPYGAYDKTTEVLAKQAGYQYGLTYNHRPLRDSRDLFAIDRVGVWSDMNVVKFLQGLSLRKP